MGENTKTINVSNEIVLKKIELSNANDIFNTINSQRLYLGEWLPFVKNTTEISFTKNAIKSLIGSSDMPAITTYIILFNDKFAGLCGCKDQYIANKNIELGYWLSQNLQGKGIIRQSVKKLIKHIFTETDINRIVIKCAVGNTKSSNIPKKLNFIFEGIEREAELFPDGSFKDIEVYSLLRREFYK